jgi:hypothetical protein
MAGSGRPLTTARRPPFIANEWVSGTESLLRLGVQPVVDVFAHQILGQAIALLDLAFQLIAEAVDLGQIIVGQLSPLLLDLANFCLILPFAAFQFPSIRFQSICAVSPGCQLSNTANVTRRSSVPRRFRKLHGNLCGTYRNAKLTDALAP